MSAERMLRQNVETMRRVYAAFNRGDLDAVAANVAPDAEYVTSGAIPGAGGVYRGPQGLRRLFGWLREEFDDVRVDVDDVTGAGDQVLVSMISRGRGKQSGVEATWATWQVWTLVDGKMARGKGFTSIEEARRAAGLSEHAMSEENVEVVRGWIEAQNRADLEGWLSRFASEAEWHTSGRFVDRGVYRGREGLTRYWTELQEDIEELTTAVSEIQAIGDKVFAAVTLRGRGRQSKARFEERAWLVATCSEGLIERVEAYLDADEAREAAGLSG